MNHPDDTAIVIGAGMGGLAAAIRLAAANVSVTVIEARPGPGGKMRTVDSDQGPIDAGPTVLTMRSVFDGLFADAGARLDDHVTLIPQTVIARHWWPDGTTLDLHSDAEASAAAIRQFAGVGEERGFRNFSRESTRLHAAFERPMIRSPRPDIAGIISKSLKNPALWPALMPGATLARRLARHFEDPRLRQLFGRYSTYVGGSPYLSPAVLGLIWHTEASGVWAVRGGMHRLAQAMCGLAEGLGARVRFGLRADRIVTEGDRATGVALSDGTILRAGQIVFNGDPAALSLGLLGKAANDAVDRAAVTPRSLSAWVWSFSAVARGLPLALHNVFFTADPRDEFGPLARGRTPDDASIYICAQDRAEGVAPTGPERFEFILNAPATDQISARPTEREYQACRTRTFDTLARMGLTFDPLPGPEALTGPAQFARMFPGSGGALYGRSPHGLTAALRRPGPQTAIPGLWICGGGTHPGAGVPMATLSGMNAADAILARRASMSASHRTDTRGGTSMASPTTEARPFRS